MTNYRFKVIPLDQDGLAWAVIDPWGRHVSTHDSEFLARAMVKIRIMMLEAEIGDEEDDDEQSK